jgi:hypothetical protein
MLVGAWNENEYFCLCRIKMKSKFKVFVIMIICNETAANKIILFVVTKPLG